MTVSITRRRICDLSRQQLVEWCQSQNEAAYRADQIFHWLFGQRVTEFAQMRDLPTALRVRLDQEFSAFTTTIAEHQVAKDRTEKLLLDLADGNRIECVLMRESNRRTACISTQVGCGMGCVFCASGLEGLQRNLTCGEVLEQILRLDRLLRPDERLTNLVVMGIGEPLGNLPALLPALEVCGDESGFALGARRITISTVGLPERIRELAQIGKPYNLAVSLHAPNDRLRSQLVPVSAKIGIRAVLAAADEYFERTGRRVTYEYVLLGQVNDEPKHARQLAAALKGRNAHVNLIPLNQINVLDFKEPSAPRTHEFLAMLRNSGVTATVRKRKGDDIDAACGQLRLRHKTTRRHDV